MACSWRNVFIISIVWTLTLSFDWVVKSEAQTTSPDETVKIIDQRVDEAKKELGNRLKDRFDAKTKRMDEKLRNMESRLEKQSENHFIVVNRHYDSLNKIFENTRGYFEFLINRSSWIIGFVLALTSFLIWKKDKNLTDVIEKRIEDAKNRVRERISDMEMEVKRSHDSLAVGLERFDAMKSNYRQVLEENVRLRDQLESMTAFRYKKVFWCYETLDIDTNDEIADIRNEGFNLVVCKPGQEANMDSASCDFMIYAFNKSENSVRRLEDIIRFLKAGRRSVPLIVYTFNKGAPVNLSANEFAVLGEYRQYVPANTPLTLKSHFNSLIRLDQNTDRTS